MRDDILDMEVAARQFEKEENVVHEVEKHCRKSDDSVLPSSGAKNDGYYGLSTEISQLKHRPTSPPLCKGTATAENKTSYDNDSGFGSTSLVPTKYPHININVRFTPLLTCSSRVCVCLYIVLIWNPMLVLSGARSKISFWLHTMVDPGYKF